MSLEHKDDVVLAGGLLRGQDFSPIYVRPDTGDVVYEEEQGGAVMLIDGLTETNPITLPNTDSIELALRTKGFGEDIIGVIYLQDHGIVLTSESRAERRALHSLFQPGGNPIEIDLNAVDPLSEEDDDLEG
jgi:hypothetical protein